MEVLRAWSWGNYGLMYEAYKALGERATLVEGCEGKRKGKSRR